MHVAAIAVQGCSCWSKAVPDVAWPPSPNGCKYIAPSETIEIVENYAMPCNAKVYFGSLVFRQTALCRSSSPQGTSPCWEAETKRGIRITYQWISIEDHSLFEFIWWGITQHQYLSNPSNWYISLLHFTSFHCTSLHSFAFLCIPLHWLHIIALHWISLNRNIF